MKKKIAIIIERVNVALGGAERSVSELANALSKLGLDVHILAAKGRTDSENIHILCEDISGKRVSYSTFVKALAKHLSENHYDLIHSVLPFDFVDVYQPRGGTYAETILRNIASYQNKPIETYKKLTAFTNFRRSTLLRAERKLATQSNGPVIAVLSEYVAKQFKKHYGTNDKRIMIIPNGVKTDKQVNKEQTEKLRTKILTELNISQTDKPVLFLFVANNLRLKGLAPLLKAMSEVTNNNTEHKSYLIVAGNGKVQKYRHIAEKLNIHNKVVFLGYIENIQNALSIIDVAVLPTFYDPSSRYILEALVTGKPVITTKFNGATDLFVDNRHGKVIDTPENITALTEAIIYFTNPNNIQKISQAIVEDNIVANISIERVAKQLVSVYENILQRKG
jgi:UDP-glucose:(heptosyl)LPS alpha-1,3-glucosyltransferase